MPWDDDEEFDDDFYADTSDSTWCNYCQNMGYMPAPDFMSIKGISRVPCEHCERGLDQVGTCD